MNDKKLNIENKTFKIPSESEIMRNWKGDLSKPLVSVCTITYNHEKYIAQAIDSFLMQETDFPFEIVIDDDCSTDNNQEVIRQYAEKYPNIIKANLRTHNVGMHANVIANLKRAKGKYIALCEGDDYWTDPLKLQKQVDFLEGNDGYVMISSNVYKLTEHDKQMHRLKKFEKDFDYSVSELMILPSSPVATLTAMFRNCVQDYSKVPFEKYWAGDKQLWMYLMQFGKGRYMNSVFGVYRKHPGGVTASISNTKEKSIALIKNRMQNHEDWNAFYNYRYDDEIKLLRHKESFALLVLYLKTWKITKAIHSSKNVELEKLVNKKHKIIVSILKIF